MKSVKLPKVRFVTVLWDLLCDKGEKVTYWNTLEEAHGYIESIESGLQIKTFDNEMHYMLGYKLLASVRVELVDINFINGYG